MQYGMTLSYFSNKCCSEHLLLLLTCAINLPIQSHVLKFVWDAQWEQTIMHNVYVKMVCKEVRRFLYKFQNVTVPHCDTICKTVNT